MILFTAGHPFSGKSELIKYVLSSFGDHTVIDPTQLRPPEYEQMSEQDKASARIAAWEVSLEMLTTAMNKPNSHLVVFDTCAAKSSVMLQQFMTAKAKKHLVFYAFVTAPMAECQARAGTKWPRPDIIRGYSRDFLESVPKLRKACDRFLAIKNNNDVNRVALKAAAQRIVKVLKEINETSRIHKPEPVRSAARRA